MQKEVSAKQAELLNHVSMRCIAYAAVGLLCLFLIAADASAQDPNELKSPFEGYFTLRNDVFLVSKDKGRFREDNWMTDKTTGGLDRLYLKSRRSDQDEYEWTIRGRAMYDYDYDFSLQLKKKDSHYFLIEFDGLRRYFDGSNEYWNAPIKRLAEKDDSDFFVDRRNYRLEFGITFPDELHFIFGWHRLEKDGKEVLLRGADAVAVGGGTVSAVPVVSNVKGTTDTFYAEAAQTFADKYNFRVRQEFEQYHENQRVDLSSFDINGNVDLADIQRDHLGYTNWRTMLMFDSFLDEETYVTSNYMYNYLNNNSTRDIAGYHELTTDKGSSTRRTNVGAFGYLRDYFGGIEGLTLTAGLRLEDSKTESYMGGSSKYYNFITHGYTDPAKPRIVNSRADEVRAEEMLRLVYRGFKCTTLSFDADLEQRDLRWSERDRHGGVFSDPDNSRKADIDFFDQEYTWKAVHRFNAAVRSTALFRVSDRQRSYSELLDDTAFYPGYLGDYRRTGKEVMLKTDWRLNSRLTSTLKYQFIQESIDTSIGGKTQNMEIHRGAGSFSLYPSSDLYLVAAFMLENYELSTPAIGTVVNHAQGSSPYDFRGNSYSILLDGTYVISDKTSFDFGFQHTEAMGKVDFAGDYIFDQVNIAVKHKTTINQIVSVGYQFINYNDHGGSFDDYRGHGLSVSYTYHF